MACCRVVSKIYILTFLWVCTELLKLGLAIFFVGIVNYSLGVVMVLGWTVLYEAFPFPTGFVI